VSIIGVLEKLWNRLNDVVFETIAAVPSASSSDAGLEQDDRPISPLLDFLGF
jgi:hypothetical protein